MNALLKNVFATKEFLTTKGEQVKIHSETSMEQCEFLQRILMENHFSNSLEIGFAYGISALAITEIISANNGKHTIIDKFENVGWGGAGIDLLQQAGFQNQFEFHEDYSYVVLPKFLQDSKKFDFAYVDSTKIFDWLVVDFFFLDKILIKNGIIVFDDVSFPGIRKLLRLISQIPSYKVYATYPKNEKSKKDFAKLFLKNVVKSKKFIRQDILLTDFDLGIDSQCVAIQKIEDDGRNWDWHVEF